MVATDTSRRGRANLRTGHIHRPNHQRARLHAGTRMQTWDLAGKQKTVSGSGLARIERHQGLIDPGFLTTDFDDLDQEIYGPLHTGQ